MLWLVRPVCVNNGRKLISSCPFELAELPEEAASCCQGLDLVVGFCLTSLCLGLGGVGVGELRGQGPDLFVGFCLTSRCLVLGGVRVTELRSQVLDFFQ